MAATFNAALNLALTVIDPVVTPGSVSTSASVTHSGLNTVATLTPTSTPAASKLAAFTTTLGAAPASVDLTATTGTNGAVISGNTKTARAILIKAAADNSGDITIAPGGSNGYALLGAAFSVTLAPGQVLSAYLGAGAPVIGSSAKTLAISGTEGDELQVEIVMG